MTFLENARRVVPGPVSKISKNPAAIGSPHLSNSPGGIGASSFSPLYASIANALPQRKAGDSITSPRQGKERIRLTVASCPVTRTAVPLSGAASPFSAAAVCAILGGDFAGIRRRAGINERKAAIADEHQTTGAQGGLSLYSSHFGGLCLPGAGLRHPHAQQGLLLSLAHADEHDHLRRLHGVCGGGPALFRLSSRIRLFPHPDGQRPASLSTGSPCWTSSRALA